MLLVISADVSSRTVINWDHMAIRRPLPPVLDRLVKAYYSVVLADFGIVSGTVYAGRHEPLSRLGGRASLSTEKHAG